MHTHFIIKYFWYFFLQYPLILANWTLLIKGYSYHLEYYVNYGCWIAVIIIIDHRKLQPHIRNFRNNIELQIGKERGGLFPLLNFNFKVLSVKITVNIDARSLKSIVCTQSS